MKKTLLFAGIAGLLSLASCTTNNVQQFPDNTVQYTVQVVSAASLGFHKTHSTEGVSGATVTINQNGKVTAVTTGADGLAAFKVLPGTVAVNVTAGSFTTLNFVATITVPNPNTGGTNPGTTVSQSYSSTLATLFPTSGTGTATITGKALCTTDFTASPANQATQAVSGTKVTAFIASGQLLSFVSSAGNGAVANVAYEGTSSQSSTGSDGTYTLTVPAAGAAGLNIDVKFDDIAPTITNTTGSFPSGRTIYSGAGLGYTTTVFSGQSFIRGDVRYN